MDAKIVRQAEKGLKPFPQRLSGLLQEKGITQEELARELGKSRQAVSLYCNKTEPDFETLVKIAVYLGVTVDYLVGMPGEELPTHEAASVAEQTGLSPKAAAALIERNKTPDRSIQFFISAILSSKYAYNLSVSFLMLIDTIGKEREKAGGTIGEPCTHDDLDEYFEHRHMIDGARYGVDRQFNFFLDETEQRAMDLDMEADDGKGEE
jgi:DNA-binding XRE family transcriptional regulator